MLTILQEKIDITSKYTFQCYRESGGFHYMYKKLVLPSLNIHDEIENMWPNIYWSEQITGTNHLTWVNIMSIRMWQRVPPSSPSLQSKWQWPDLPLGLRRHRTFLLTRLTKTLNFLEDYSSRRSLPMKSTVGTFFHFRPPDILPGMDLQFHVDVRGLLVWTKYKSEHVNHDFQFSWKFHSVKMMLAGMFSAGFRTGTHRGPGDEHESQGFPCRSNKTCF